MLLKQVSLSDYTSMRNRVKNVNDVNNSNEAYLHSKLVPQSNGEWVLNVNISSIIERILDEVVSVVFKACRQQWDLHKVV